MNTIELESLEEFFASKSIPTEAGLCPSIAEWLEGHPGSTAAQAASALGFEPRIVGSVLSQWHKAGKLTAQSIWLPTNRPTITRATLHYSIASGA
jgi:hypothetical protein